MICGIHGQARTVPQRSNHKAQSEREMLATNTRVDPHPRMLFARLIHSIQPTASEKSRSTSHMSTIRRRVTKSFDIARIIPIGSFSRSTAITTYSDHDLLVLLKRNEAKWGDKLVSSSTVLGRVRNDLNSRYTATTVRSDKQAAVINFGGGRHRFDIVPALFSHFDQKRPIYGIPDGSGGWLATSPMSHNQWLKKAHLRSAGKLTKSAQLLKHWANMRANSSPACSFYLELWLALHEVCIGARSYSEILTDAFNQLDRTGCSPIEDPIGISGWIHSCRTDSQHLNLRDAIRTSAFHSERALAAEHRRNNKEARRQWEIVFNGGFS